MIVAGGADQLGLFGQPAEADEVRPAAAGAALADLAARLPAELRLGTSSWTFPGWGPLVYDSDGKLTERTLARGGLRAYSGHPLHRTVGLDRAFYRPPAREAFEELAEQVPQGFRFVVKAWQGITRPDADEHGRTHGDTATLREHGVANERFLDAEAATDLVIAPAVLGLGDRLGPIVFQFPPLDLGPDRGAGRGGAFGGVMGLVDGLVGFASRLPAGRAPIALEFRNRELFEPEPLAALSEGLRTASVAIGMAHHPTLPTIDAQRRALEDAGYGFDRQPFMVCRWLLRHGESYVGAKKKYQPFDRLVDADVPTREAVAEACREAVRMGRPSYVIANNKAEGSAPLTLQRLAQAIAGGSGDASGTLDT